MQITVNGKPGTFKENLSVQELLAELGYRDHFVAIAVNQECVLRRDYGTQLIKVGDNVEILAPMAGG